MARNKMNPARRHDARVSLQGRACMTCNLPVCWSSQTDDKAAHKATLGHVVADTIGGKCNPDNIGVQCWACNWDAKTRRVHDLTASIVPGALTAWVSGKVGQATADPREVAPATGLPTWADRRAARAARGLAW